MYLQRAEPSFDGVKPNIEEHCDDERTESRAFKPFRNITKANPIPNSKYVNPNKVESAPSNISTYGCFSID